MVENNNKKLTSHEIWVREYERARAVAPICPRCKRPMVGWDLKRKDICSPPDWRSCIRNPKIIKEKINNESM